MAEDAGLWSDPQKAQRLMQERTSLEDRLNALERIDRDFEDDIGMIELGEAENDADTENEGLEQLRALKLEGEKRQLEALLSGEADGNDTYVEGCDRGS